MTSTTSHPGAPAREPAPGDVLWLSRADVRAAMGGSIRPYVEALRGALSLHAAGDTAQPLKPYLRWRENGHIADRIIAMPGYVGGSEPIAGIKWIGSKHDNPSARGIPRASAVIVLNDAETHFPVAIMEGGEISGMRTAGVSVLACELLARPGFSSVALVGCGFIGRLHALGLLEVFGSIRSLRLYDHERAAAEGLARELADRNEAAAGAPAAEPTHRKEAAAETPAAQPAPPGLDVRVCASAEEAVLGAEVVVPCTVADAPYIPFDWLAPGVFVSNISLMDVEPDAYVRVDKLVVDDWDQCNREGKTLHTLVQEGRFSRDRLHAELGDVVRRVVPGRESPDERIMLSPMGMAIEDVACAAAVYRHARAQGTGTWLALE
jgi:ornithine cyclodeaminase/alanine dehydrogenase-like protein (mu-crystallin family)